MIYLSFLTLIFFLIFPLDIALSARDALTMCFASVIPSLFPFMVLSRIIISSGGIKEDNFLFKLTGKLFKISNGGVWALALGLVCGYPVGAKIICDLFNEERISKWEAERLMLFSNNAGPGFVIATVGGMFFSDTRAGIIIYISHILSSLIIAFVLSFFSVKIIINKRKTPHYPAFSKVLVNSVTDSVIGVLNVTGIIVFFSVLMKVLDITGVTSLMPLTFSGIFKGMLEMTSGIKTLVSSDMPYNLKIIFSSFLVSFSGLSVFCQILSFSDRIKLKFYLPVKLLSGLLTMLVCSILI